MAAPPAAAQAVVLGDPLPSPPTDGISALRFSTESDLLIAASWDRTVRLYDSAQASARGVIEAQAPVLDVCLQDDGTAFCGCLDGQIKRLSLHQGGSVYMAHHNAAVRCIEFLPSRGLVLSGSWDSTVRGWDPRAPPHQSCIQVIPLPGKVYTMSCSKDSQFVVGTSERHVLIFDLRKLAPGGPPLQPEQVRESSLKYQTRVVACYTDGRGYALGSVEGRVAMEYFDQSPEAQANKYAFKCHRRQENGKDMAFPVHSIVFHPGYGTFATGGGDGVINLWDGDNKKRLFQISKYPNTVSAMAFSRDGSMLAVASSYTYERGDVEHGADEIYIRKMQDPEVKPKQRQPQK